MTETATRPRQSTARTIAASVLGNILEWFDYAVFGFLIGPIGAAFFPSGSSASATLGAWLVFAIGFFARPLGGIVLGRLGDRKGRRWLLTASVSLIAGSTLAMGCMPTYAQLGWLATAGLVACRIVQGFSLGGEFTGSMAYATEQARPSMRGLVGGSTAVGSMLGFLAGSGAVGLLSRALTPEQVGEWGWRLPFLASSAFAGFAWWVRRSVEETEAGEASRAMRDRPGALASVIRDWRPSLRLLGIVAFANALYYYAFDAAVVDAKAASPEHAAALQGATTLSLLAMAACTVIGGWMSDCMGRRATAVLFTIWGLAFIVPGWLVLSSPTATPAGFLCAQLLLGIPVGLALGMQGTMLVEMFPLATRVVSMSFAYSVAMALAGGLMPALNEWMVDDLHMPRAPLAWLTALGAAALLTLGTMRDPAGRDLKT